MKEVSIPVTNHIIIRFEGNYCDKRCQSFFEDCLDGPNLCGTPMCSLYGKRDEQLQAEQTAKNVWQNKRCQVCKNIHGI